MSATYLFLDNETGGIGTEYSLLTTYLVILDENFQKVSDLYLYLKPNDGIYKVCGTAMAVNNINLVEHDKKAVYYKLGGSQLYNWLSANSIDGKIKLVVVGHGIYGDVENIVQNLMNRGSWEKFTSYRKLDTQAVVQFLKACGFFIEDVGSLSSIAKYLHITVDESQLHDAKYDTELTIEVFKALKEWTTSNWEGWAPK